MIPIQPLQIVYMEHRDARLSAEVIQTANRDRIWSRPLMLVLGLPNRTDRRRRAITEAAENPDQSALRFFDLEQSPDLVWPMDAFEPAFDTEFFSLMVNLKVSNKSASTEQAQRALRHFLQSCWHPPRSAG